MSLLAKAPGPQDGSILRFDPAYWQIDFNIRCAASLVTAGDRALKLSCTFRTDKDLVGLIWHSVDGESHQIYRYGTDYDYRGCILRFDFRLTNLLPMDDASGLVLTAIENNESETPYYVRLENYRIAGSTTHGRVLLDFSTVEGGFNLPAEAVTIPWHNIKRFFIGVIPPAYVPAETDPDQNPIAETESTLELYNIFCTGDRTTLPICVDPQPAHSLRIADGLDDAYHLTPQRIVEGIQRLGYRGWYVLYLGITHMHQVSWDEGEGRFVVDPGKPVLNAPTRVWLTDLFMRLAGNGFRIVVSLSYEILKSVCPSSWMQRGWNDAPAQTGWEPPSSLIAPTSTEALDYLVALFDWCMGTLKAMGAPLFFQLGEPWWWDGTYTDGAPCIYDAGTRALFTSETGFAVPTPFLQSSFADIGPHGPYLSWLRDKLGASTLYLRDGVKAAYPGATSLILIFTPQVLNPAAPILEILNFPYRSWRSPAWDIVQLEDYDWIISGDWTLHSGTLAAGTGKLGYDLDRLHFFGGFNLLASTADTIWPRIDQALNDGFQWGVAETYVWARPQVWRDGFLWQASAETEACTCGCADYEGGPIRSGGFSFIPAPGTGGSAVPPYDDPGDFGDIVAAPSDLQMVGNTFGDVRLSWDPNGEDPGAVSYTVTIYDPGTSALVRTIVIDTPTVVGGRVQYDYPVELSADDFGFAPTYLVWRVATNGTAGRSLSGAIPVNNAAIVKKAILFAGQSNALGHFTTLSGATLAQGSAALFRRELAAALGLSAVEVIPVAAAWGSSAADRFADDNPTTGTNYWWDVNANTAGPRLQQAVAIITGLGVPLAGIIWAQGENDASAMNPVSAPRTSIVSRYKAATEAIFAGLRTAAGNASLPIWLQTMGRGYWGDLPDPPEVGGVYYKAVRDVQVQIVTEQAATFVGSWVPGCESIAGYVPEVGNPGFIHHTASVYAATAVELAEAVAVPLDRLSARPAWTLLAAPAGFVRADDGADAVVTWPATTGAQFVVRNINVVDGSLIGAETVTASAGVATWTFDAADQVAAYGFSGVAIRIDVYQLAGAVRGPSATFTAVAPDEVPEVGDAPINLAMAATNWGDMVLSFEPTQESTAGHTYTVQVMNGASVKRQVVLAAPALVGGRVLVDYPVEQSIPDWGWPPSYLRWRVYADAVENMAVLDAPVTVNNAAIVARTFAIGGQSLALGHFTTLSGTDARRDLVSAGALRRALADAWGLRHVEVMPVAIAWGSAAADKLADDDPVSGVNHWWNLDANTAGPRLTEALATLAGLGVPLDYLIWDQGQNDASAIYLARTGDPMDTGRSSTPERYRAATEAIFAAIRTAAGDADLPIFLQPIMRVFWGLDADDPNPTELIGDIYTEIREVQLDMAADDPQMFVGTWAPGAEKVSGYVYDTDGTQFQWVHWNATTFHAAAAELAEAISTPLDRIGSPPLWTQTPAPVLTAHWSGLNAVLTWPGTTGDLYRVDNTNVETNRRISLTAVTVAGGTGTWTFTSAQQTAVYGYAGGYVYVTAYKMLADDVRGLSSTLLIEPAS